MSAIQDDSRLSEKQIELLGSRLGRQRRVSERSRLRSLLSTAEATCLALSE